MFGEVKEILENEAKKVDVVFRFGHGTFILKRFGWRIVYNRQKSKWYRLVYDDFKNQNRSSNIVKAGFVEDLENKLKSDLDSLQPDKNNNLENVVYGREQKHV